jgi:pyridoxine kinase
VTVLDPVMGDEGRLYIPHDEVPVYKCLLRDADLILPNQFEAELLSDTKITCLRDIATAVEALHRNYQVPHVIITSIRLSPNSDTTLPSTATTPEGEEETMTIIGSTSRSDHTPRMFRIDIPAFPVFFSGTGDMFAALTVARLRQAVFEAGLQSTQRWKSPDEVEATELPLAKASEKVLASMQSVLGKTYEYYKVAVKGIEAAEDIEGLGTGEEALKNGEQKRHLRRTKAAEVRVVRHVRDLIYPPELDKYRAKPVELEYKKPEDAVADELGVVNLGGRSGHRAVHVEDDP